VPSSGITLFFLLDKIFFFFIKRVLITFYSLEKKRIFFLYRTDWFHIEKKGHRIKKKDERKSAIMRWHSLVNLFMRPLLVRYGIPFYWISSGTNWDENIFRFIDFWVDQCLHRYSLVYDLIKNKVLLNFNNLYFSALLFSLISIKYQYDQFNQHTSVNYFFFCC